MQPPHTSTPSGVGPYRVTSIPGEVAPTDILDAFEGEARGFWGGWDRWIVWGGELARIEIAPATPDRFAEVRREMAGILDDLGWLPSAPRGAGAPRFFGGLSFLETGPEDPVWAGFPSAGFILPRVMVERTGAGLRALTTGSEAEIEGLLSRAAADRQPVGESAPGDPPSEPEQVLEPDSAAQARWRAAVDGVLAAIAEDRVRKAVLARILDLRLPKPVDPLAALRFLRMENRRAHVFLMEPRPGRVFLGAAPELLTGLRGDRFEATAVAGSMPRSLDPEEDRERVRRLLASAKDRDEHALTAEDMVEVLGSHLEGMEVEDVPRVLSLARIHHLETAIRGTPHAGEDVLSLIEALHPTPAVCGRPRAEALALIRAAEPFDRGWYSGPVGWFDADGAGEFVPALRAAVGQGRTWRLFAGAGIVAGSDPVAEWEETALKFEPAMRALRAGAGDPPEDD